MQARFGLLIIDKLLELNIKSDIMFSFTPS